MGAALVLRHLERRFGALRALDDVSLELAEGERRAVIGPNGAGKTTLFHLVSGVLPPTAGSVELFGIDVTRSPTRRRVAMGMARTFQITNLFPKLTVKQNVVLALQGLAPSKLFMFRLLSSFPALSTRAEALLEAWQLSTISTALVTELSYGEQRSLEILLAVAQDPRLLLLDEPTAGLSPAETAAVVEIVRALPTEMAILLIEHDMDVAFQLCTSLTVLHLGQVLATGDQESVRGAPRVQEIYLGEEQLAEPIS